MNSHLCSIKSRQILDQRIQVRKQSRGRSTVELNVTDNVSKPALSLKNSKPHKSENQHKANHINTMEFQIREIFQMQKKSNKEPMAFKDKERFDIFMTLEKNKNLAYR